LLLCDAGLDGPAWNVSDVATALGVTSRAIEHLKKRFVEDGLEAALERKPREKPPNELKPHLSKYWKIPPEGSAAFVVHVEDVLEIYDVGHSD
jgi:hypothetical protein